VLVLSRQKDESIIVGDDIVITIVDIRGDKVRLGIDAPPHVSVHRKEIYEAIKRELKKPEEPAPLKVHRVHEAGPIPKPQARKDQQDASRDDDGTG